jgi:hypothetical protein
MNDEAGHVDVGVEPDAPTEALVDVRAEEELFERVPPAAAGGRADLATFTRCRDESHDR